MKSFLRTYAIVLLALFVASSAFASEPGPKKKQLGIATYSVKGLESDIEGSFKSLQEKWLYGDGNFQLQCPRRKGGRLCSQ